MERTNRTKQSDNRWPESGLESVPNCPVCESTRRDLFYDNLTDRVFFCAPGAWSLYQCTDCQCAYLDPRPSPDAIGLAYRRYYTHARADENYSQALRGRQCLYRSLANGYRNWKFATDLQPTNRFGIAVMILLPTLRQRLDHGFRHLPPLIPGARLLDVGFGAGAFLEFARHAGWAVAGVDTDPVSIQAATERGLDVRRGGIEAFADMPESFDVVTLSHVLEHAHNPVALLHSAYRLLKPGGFLWLSTPNLESFGLARYGRNWLNLDPPRHLVLFRWQAIRELLRKIGFHKIQEDHSNFLYARIAAQSEAMAKGVDPYAVTSLSFRHHLTTLMAGAKIWFQPHRTEFITCQALKPVNR